MAIDPLFVNFARKFVILFKKLVKRKENHMNTVKFIDAVKDECFNDEEIGGLVHYWFKHAGTHVPEAMDIMLGGGFRPLDSAKEVFEDYEQDFGKFLKFIKDKSDSTEGKVINGEAVNKWKFGVGSQIEFDWFLIDGVFCVHMDDFEYLLTEYLKQA